MSENESNTKVRYPVRAILVVGVAWLGFFLLMLGGFATIALIAPVAIVYVGALVGYVGVVSAAHAYARENAIVVSVRSAGHVSADTRPHPSASGRFSQEFPLARRVHL